MNARLVTLSVYLAAFVAFADQTSKWWILNVVMKPPRTHIVTPYFNLVLSWNKGITFGLFNHGHPSMAYVFIAAAILILVLLLHWLIHTNAALAAVGLALVMGGAIGNIIDRVTYGAVVDFLDFHAYGYHWYAFNVADSAIVTGVGLLFIEKLVSDAKKR